MENPFLILQSNLTLRLDNIESILSQILERLESQVQTKQNRYVDKVEAAKIAGVSKSTIDNWRRTGKLKSHLFGASVRFYLPEFMEFLESQ